MDGPRFVPLFVHPSAWQALSIASSSFGNSRTTCVVHNVEGGISGSCLVGIGWGIGDLDVVGVGV